jgi:hypothetical protein
MLRTRTIKYSLALGVGMLAGPPASPQVPAGIQTRGNCSPVITQSQVSGRVTIECGAGRDDLRRLEERLNQLIAGTGMSRAEVGDFTQLLNTFADLRLGRGRLSGAMTVWLSSALQIAASNPNVTMYIGYIDNRDGGFSANNEGVQYQLIAMQPSVFDTGDGCRSNRFEIFGWKDTANIASAGATTTRTELPRNDPILQQICRSMADRLSALMTSRRDRNTELTVFDYLARGKSAVVLILIARPRSEFRPDDLRAFWAGAFVARHFGTAASLDMSPEAFAEAAEERSVAVSLEPFSSFRNLTYDEPYSPQIIQEFGQDLAEMDSRWRRFIAQATVTLRGAQLPAHHTGRSQSTSRAFLSSEVGSPAFWMGVVDTTSLMNQRTCLAARFAIDNGYVAAGDLPAYQACGVPLYGR